MSSYRLIFDKSINHIQTRGRLCLTHYNHANKLNAATLRIRICANKIKVFRLSKNFRNSGQIWQFILSIILPMAIFEEFLVKINSKADEYSISTPK